LITAAHDLSDGGLAVAATEMAMNAGVGVTVLDGDTGWFFGEDQARYALATSDSAALVKAAEAAGVPAQTLGSFGGSEVVLGSAKIALATIEDCFNSALKSKVV